MVRFSYWHGLRADPEIRFICLNILHAMQYCSERIRLQARLYEQERKGRISVFENPEQMQPQID